MNALIDSLIKNGQIKSSPSSTSSTGGDTIGLDRLTAGSFTGPDTPPPTSIYPEVPPDQRDTSFLNAKKKILSDLFAQNGVDVSFDRSLNGPSSVSYDIRWKDADDWATIQKILKNDSAIGSRVSFELHPNSEPNTARLHITNPKPRDAGVRRLLEASDMKTVSRMGVPFLAGEAEDGSPIWVDLKEHGFVGGDSGSGKTARILAGVAGMLHAKSPEEVQLIVNAHANPGDYDTLSDDPHCIRIGDSYDAVAENLRSANAEWKRRKELFANAHVKDIGAYNALMKSQGHPEKCLPFQLTITDEVTNLLAERPELAREIQGIVTNGRKYGVVHLGATQDMGSQNLKGMTDMKGAVRIGVQSTNPTASDKIFGERVQGLRDIAKKGDCIVKDGSGKIRRLRGAYASDAHWKALRDYDANAYHRVDAPPKAA